MNGADPTATSIITMATRDNKTPITTKSTAQTSNSATDLARRQDRFVQTKALHAFITIDIRLERAQRSTGSHERSTPRWLLAVKDNIDVAGMPTTGGIDLLAQHIPTQSATVVERLERAEALVIGKTNMDELAYGATGDNHCFGRVAHPADPSRIVGGSSAGSAVAVATAVADAGLGTETGCSVRVPAALCGLFGFRPTTGRYPLDGVLPVSPTRDTIGLMARDLATIRDLDTTITGRPPTPSPDHRTPRLTIPRWPFYALLSPDLLAATQRRLDQLDAAGWELTVADLPPTAHKLHQQCALLIPSYETPPAMNNYLIRAGLSARFADLADNVANPEIAATLKRLRDDPIPLQKYLWARSHIRPALGRLMRQFFDDHRIDAIMVPTSPITAPVLKSGNRITVDGNLVSAFDTFLRNTDLSSCLGWPALTIPALHDSNGLPFGMDLQAPPGYDLQLLTLAEHCQRIWQVEQRNDTTP
jgi:indoleacetamide hydrolase